jgi:addiction module HigA family antidote
MMTKDNRRNLISHPGRILKEEFLEPMGITVYALSRAIGVPRTRINDIVLKRRGISADTAIRLAKFFGTTPESWMNLQKHYDLVMAETAPGNKFSKVRTLKDIRAEELAHA